MDRQIQQNLDELIAELNQTGLSIDDPVAKLLAVTLLHQAQKIKDEIAKIPDRIVERLCTVFVPKNKIDAIPAMALVQPSLKIKRDVMPHQIADGSFYTFKVDAKQSLSYYPLYRNMLLPFTKTYLVSPAGFRTDSTYTKIQFGKKGQVWFGMEMSADVETLENVSFFIKGTGGILPRRIAVDNSDDELAFTTADRMESMPIAEPFDSQQMNSRMVMLASNWQDMLSKRSEGALICVIDKVKDRDLFKCKAYPKSFQMSLESNDLDKFENNTLWLLFDFGSDYDVPEDIDIIPNVVPVVNVNVNAVTLTQSSPIAKLTKNDGAFYVSMIETPLSLQKQGFNVNEEEFVVRDFDAESYNADNLFKDIRNLYNHFIDDYYAFVDYHGLKDGELIRSLRETINKVGKSAQTNQEGQNRFDEGVYAMRNVKLLSRTSPVKVSYLTTFGRKGNLPRVGMLMENRKDAALEKDIHVIASAEGGEDRATADRMYEMLRYYTLTADRLYTKMDVDAYIRMQLLKEFGKEEVKRISYEIGIHGAEGERMLQRGLYIDIHFKDQKNYEKARSISLDNKLHQQIVDKSCIAMPIIIAMHNTEE